MATALPFAVAVGAAVLAGRRDGSTLFFRTTERSIAFLTAEGCVEAPFESIESWEVREKWEERKGEKGERERAGYVLYLLIKDREAVHIHDFAGGEAERVARKVAERLSSITGTRTEASDAESSTAGEPGEPGKVGKGTAGEELRHDPALTVTPRLGGAALSFAVGAAVLGMSLLPLALSKPGRILTTAEGGIIINPVSLRGLGVLLAADVALVVGILLWGSLFRPRASLLPVRAALVILGGAGVAVGALGLWLLLDPWRPERDAGLVVPPGTPVDLAGFACAAVALFAIITYRSEYVRFWEKSADGRPEPERDQSIDERLRNGFFMGLIAGTLAGTFAAAAAVAIAHVLGSPMTHRVYFIVGCGTSVSVLVQVYLVRAGLRGQITKGRGMGVGR